MNNQNNNKENKEEFCGACLTVPLAMAAGGSTVAAASTAVDKEKHKKIKDIMFVVGIVIAVLSILYSIYALCKQQKSDLGVCNK